MAESNIESVFKEVASAHRLLRKSRKRNAFIFRNIPSFDTRYGKEATEGGWHRMSSLLPKPYGCGTRKNIDKRNYVFKNISDIEYRTFACQNVKEAKELESNLKSNGTYRFKR